MDAPLDAAVDPNLETIDPRAAREAIAEQLNVTQEEDEEREAETPGFDAEHVRMAEALLFAAAEPLDEATIADRLPEGVDVPSALEALQAEYKNRGVNLCKIAKKWAFRTAEEHAHLMEKERVEPRKLSRAALETLAIIAYHQPVTRAEIEEIRGVSISRGTLDFLMEIGWARLRGRRRAPGKPVTYGTTDEFLEHFGLSAVTDLPGMDELKAAGLLDGRLPPGFAVPTPGSAEDEEELDAAEAEFVEDFLEDEAGESEANLEISAEEAAEASADDGDAEA